MDFCYCSRQVAELLTAEAEDDRGRAISSGRGPSRMAPVHESRGAGLKVAEAGSADSEPAVAAPTAAAGVEEGAAGSQRQGRAAQGKSTRTKRQRDDN